jgi:hypothetical protein
MAADGRVSVMCEKRGVKVKAGLEQEFFPFVLAGVFLQRTPLHLLLLFVRVLSLSWPTAGV